MIKGKIKDDIITKDYVLSKISEYDIYRHYLGKFKLNKPISSPFRRDSNPSFSVNYNKGSFYFIDYGLSCSGDAFQFVKELFHLDFNQALGKIANDFGLVNNTHSKNLICKYEVPELKEKKETLIQVKTRRFDTADLAYWGKRYQNEADLKRENIFAIKSLYINKVKIPIPISELAFAFLYEDKYWKIYRPFAKDKKDKWRTNCPIDLIDGLENLRNCKKGIITKSKKDKMCMLKAFPHVAAVQSETRRAFNDETITFINENVGTVYVSFDSDAPGKTNSIKITKELGWKHFNVPDKYLAEGIKDTDAIVEKYGLPSLFKMLKAKNIINN